MFDGMVRRLVVVHAVLHRALVSRDQILQQAGPADAQRGAYGCTHPGHPRRRQLHPRQNQRRSPGPSCPMP